MRSAYNTLLFNAANKWRVALPVTLLGLIVLLGGCAKQRYFRMAKKTTIEVNPNPLEVHGGKAQAQVVIKTPPEIIEGKYNYAVELIYNPQQGNAKPAQILRVPFQPGEYLRYKSHLAATKHITIPWEMGDPNGTLKARSVFNLNRSYKYLPYQTLAQGMITTYQLAVPEPPISYIYSPFNRKEDLNKYVFYFDHNSPRLKAYTGGHSGPLADFIAENNTSRHVIITAYQTPEETGSGKGLAQQRAENLREYYIGQVERHTYRNEASQIKFELKTITNDVAPLVQEIKKSPMPQEAKTEVLALLNAPGTYQAKVQKLRKSKHYTYLKNYVFPKLRRADMEAKYQRPEKMNFEIALTANRIAKGTVDNDQLTPEEFSYAAELTPLLDEKERIYKAAHRIHRRPQDAYNLGVLYLERARKTENTDDRKAYYSMAAQRFREAAGNINTAEVYYNLATAYFLLGDTKSANEYYDITARLKNDPEFTRNVKSARAAMLVKAGQYEEATKVLAKAPEGFSLNVSRGLIALRYDQYVEATAAFVQATAANPKQALPYYLLAVTGARTNNPELLYTNLEKAADLDETLVQRAIDDLEFRDYKKNPEFTKALK